MKYLLVAISAIVCSSIVTFASAQTQSKSPTATSAPSTQQLVPAESNIRFISKQMGVPVEGVFKRFTVQSQFDPKRPEASSVSLSVDLLSTEIGSADTEKELKKPGWFDSVRRPNATFASSAIKSVAPGKYEVDGQLSIKGVSQRVLVPVTLTQRGSVTYADGTFQIKRMDFKIGDGEWNDISIVANEVIVKFRLALTGVPAI